MKCSQAITKQRRQCLVINKSPWKFPGSTQLNRVFSGLAVLCPALFQHIRSSESTMINARTPISRDESNSNSTSIPYFSITALLGAFIGICLEWFLYGKISVVCFTCTFPITIRRSRTLFRNIRHVSKMPIGQVQEGNYRFLCSLSSPRPIHGYHYQ